MGDQSLIFAIGCAPTRPLAMPRYRCPSCCCGPALVLRPPKGATPICPRCQSPLEQQPLVRPVPLLILLSVGSVLVLSSFPILFQPLPDRSPQPHAEDTVFFPRSIQNEERMES